MINETELKKKKTRDLTWIGHEDVHPREEV